MNKKIVTIIISVCCFILMAAVVMGTLDKQGVIDTGNIFQKSPNSKTVAQSASNPNTGAGASAAPTPPAAPEDSSSERHYSAVLLKEGAEYELEYPNPERLEDQYMLFRFDGLEITKKRGDFDPCESWHDKQDASGTIISEHSYVVVKVTIINKGEKEHEITLNSLFLRYGELEGAELRSYNSNKTTTKKKDYFFVMIEPNKTYTFNLAYILEDSIIEKYKDEFLLYTSFSYVPAYIPVIEKKEE